MAGISGKGRVIFSDSSNEISEKDFLTKYNFTAAHRCLSATNEIKDIHR